MQHKFIEAIGTGNWGKFMVSRFDREWAHKSAVDERSIIASRGWSPDHIHVLDLQTGEGAMFMPGGLAGYDLNKHAIWVCPLFEPFLEWLYKQDLTDLDALPAKIELMDAEFSFAGYRREGPTDNQFTEAQKQALVAVLSLAENHQMWTDPMSQSEQFKDFTDDQYAAITEVRQMLKANGVMTLHEMTQRAAERLSA